MLSRDNLEKVIKNNNDFRSLQSKKTKIDDNNSITVFNVWEKNKNKNSFHDLKKISSIKYEDIKVIDKKNIIINGYRYKYSKYIHTDKKSISDNELVDVYILFDLICSIQTNKEISVAYKKLPEPQSGITIDENIMRKEGWKIPILSNNIVTQWQAMSTLDIAKASLKKISPNNLNPTPFKGLTTLALLGTMYFSYDIQKSWGERYDYLKSINYNDQDEYTNAYNMQQNYITITWLLAVPTAISFIDWIWLSEDGKSFE
jgi:hypothetical protein